jgi:hypothetical protein
MSNCLRDESPKVMNTNEFVDKNVEVSLLGNEGSLKRWLRSSLKSSRMSERSVAAKKGTFFSEVRKYISEHWSGPPAK